MFSQVSVTLSRNVIFREDNTQQCTVFDGADFRLTDGIGLSDALETAADIVPDDVYRLAAAAVPGAVRIIIGQSGHPSKIAPESDWGTSGCGLHCTAIATFMSESSQTVEALILEEDPPHGAPGKLCVLPLGPMQSGKSYRVIALQEGNAALWLARMNCAGLASGCRVAVADGAPRPVEELRIGDQLLTKRGPKTLRWIGQMTLRAQGPFTSVKLQPQSIPGGTGPMQEATQEDAAIGFASPRPVSVMSATRILMPFKNAQSGPQSELIRATELAGRPGIAMEEGGFIDYNILLLDAPEIVFAEGIAVETLRLSSLTCTALPPAVVARMSHSLHST